MKLGLFDLMDQAIAEELGVDVKTYIKVIETKTSDEDTDFIIMSILEGDESKKERAKELFNKYLTEDSE